MRRAQHVAGVVLAAGAGRRMGQPKALVIGRTGRPWVLDAIDVLRRAGCSEVHVAVGAAADQVREVLDTEVAVIDVPDWDLGMSASLAASLNALVSTDAEAALIHLVDLPDVGPEVVQRLLALGGPASLARAAYRNVPGHPVLIGRDHWPGVIGSLVGDKGAAAYLAAHGVKYVECGDLAGGHDIDTPEGLASHVD